MYIEMLEGIKNMVSSGKFDADFIKANDTVDQITITFLGKDNQYVVQSVDKKSAKADEPMVNGLAGKIAVYNDGKTNKKAIDAELLPVVVSSGADAPPAFTLSPSDEIISLGADIRGYTINSTGGIITSYSIDPAVDDGLLFNATTGLITGKPNSAGTEKKYTITGTNAAGLATATYTLTVNAATSGGYNAMKKSRSVGTKRKSMKLGYTRRARRSKRSM
jgi:Putative Ig domain